MEIMGGALPNGNYNRGWQHKVAILRIGLGDLRLRGFLGVWGERGPASTPRQSRRLSQVRSIQDCFFLELLVRLLRTSRRVLELGSLLHTVTEASSS